MKVDDTLELKGTSVFEFKDGKSFTSPDNPSEVMVRDEDNRWVLESAIMVKAGILVTGDKDLLDISDNDTQLKLSHPGDFGNCCKGKVAVT